MRSAAKCYDELRNYVEDVPLIDCHDHTSCCGPRHKDPIQALVTGYFPSDMTSASSDSSMAIIMDDTRPIEERWPVFEKAWKRTRHTGYAQVTRRVLREFYGEEELTLDALKRMKGKLLNLEDEKVFEDILEKAGIVARLVNILEDPTKKVLDGTLVMPPRGRLVIPLPRFHTRMLCQNAVCEYAGIQQVGQYVRRHVTSLDEYLGCCRAIFEGYKRFGAVAFKDQSAYVRPIAFGNPTRAEAEAVFNRLMSDPRRNAGSPDEIKPMDDYLFHEFMRMARDMELPVQIHTGHIAGNWNNVVKANAAQLASVLELHKEVRFDLFHANWPYGDDILFLAKNYPNVTIDFCWANIIDPIWCQNMFKRVLSCVPSGKIHAFGSDYGGNADRAWAHAQIARDNIAIALSEMVEMDYLGLDEAKETARDWLFDNANSFFRLGVR